VAGGAVSASEHGVRSYSYCPNGAGATASDSASVSSSDGGRTARQTPAPRMPPTTGKTRNTHS